VTKVHKQLALEGGVYMTLPGHFDQHFNALFARWEQKAREQQGPKTMKTFSETQKGKKVKGTPAIQKAQTSAPE
jgi:hypothetical protein